MTARQSHRDCRRDPQCLDGSAWVPVGRETRLPFRFPPRRSIPTAATTVVVRRSPAGAASKVREPFTAALSRIPRSTDPDLLIGRQPRLEECVGRAPRDGGWVTPHPSERGVPPTVRRSSWHCPSVHGASAEVHVESDRRTVLGIGNGIPVGAPRGHHDGSGSIVRGEPGHLPLDPQGLGRRIARCSLRTPCRSMGRTRPDWPWFAG